MLEYALLVGLLSLVSLTGIKDVGRYARHTFSIIQHQIDFTLLAANNNGNNGGGGNSTGNDSLVNNSGGVSPDDLPVFIPTKAGD